jgi:hypothetical protein
LPVSPEGAVFPGCPYVYDSTILAISTCK